MRRTLDVLFTSHKSTVLFDMSFNRFDENRSSYHFEKRGSRGNFISPLSSPLFRRKVFANGSGPSSLASSRDSSLDRGEAGGKGAGVPYGGLHTVVTRAVQSPKMTLRQRFQVMRSGSFNDVEVGCFFSKGSIKWVSN